MLITGLDILLYAAILPILAILIARIARNKTGSLLKSSLPAALQKGYGKKDHFAGPALKKCPKCTEELQLSALVCDTCDYNFLAGSVTHRHKMLPAPSEPLAHDASGQTFAYRT
jgi:hypothetical protein